MSGCGKNGSVRQYIRSKVPRMRWTPNLHQCFVDAIQKIGGQQKATPKLILREMGVRWLTISHIKSHLQMYRNMKKEITSQHAQQRSEGRRHSCEDNADDQADQNDDSLTYSKPLREFQFLYSLPFPLKSQEINSQYIIDDYMQDTGEEKGIKGLGLQDAAESDYFKICGSEKDQIKPIRKHNFERNHKEKLSSSLSIFENEPEDKKEMDGCALSLLVPPRQESFESSLSRASRVHSSSPISIKQCSDYSGGGIVDLDLSLSIGRS